MRSGQRQCSQSSTFIQALEGSKSASYFRPIIRNENFCITRPSFVDSGCNPRKSAGSAPRHYSASHW